MVCWGLLESWMGREGTVYSVLRHQALQYNYFGALAEFIYDVPVKYCSLRVCVVGIFILCW